MSKSAEAFRTISEVSEHLDIPKHVLRFWEVKFAQIRPMKRGGGRRYYRPEDLELLKGIRDLLHRDGYTIKGVQKILREQGVDAVKQRAQAAAAADAEVAAAPRAPAVPSAAPVAAGAARRRARPAAGPHRPGAARLSPDHLRRLAAAVAELEACRSILRGEPVGARHTERREPAGKAR